MTEICKHYRLAKASGEGLPVCMDCGIFLDDGSDPDDGRERDVPYVPMDGEIHDRSILEEWDVK